MRTGRVGSAHRLLYYAGRLRRTLISPAGMAETIKAVRDRESIVVRWPNRGEVKENWGDKLNKPLVEKISGKQVLNFSDVINVCRRPVYSVIGSSLGLFSDRELVVWGTGFISYDRRPLVPPRDIRAVRGPLSRKKYLDAGMRCPEVYGDPALLCPRFWTFGKVKKRYRIGLVPQWQDKALPLIKDVEALPDVKVIDLYGSIQGVLEEILSCECILSSSLHGLIASDAYGVPSLWLRLSENPLGDLFKFQDYYASIGVEDALPHTLDQASDLERVAAQCTVHDVSVDLDSLMAACPF